MNNRIISSLKEVPGRLISFCVNILLPLEEKVARLEALGPTGLFTNISRAENFDFETDKIKAIFNYKTSLCRQAIWEIKYRANKKLISDFSVLLYEFILEELSDLDTFHNFKNIVLLPIPSSKTRLREKGFNQCVLLSRELIKIDQARGGHIFSLVEKFLVKKTDTPHQTKVSNRKKRLANLKNTFSINPEQFPSPKKISERLDNPLSKKDFSASLGNLSERLGTPLSGESSSQAGDLKLSERLDISLSGESSSRANQLQLSDYSFILIDDVITTGATMRESFRALQSAGIHSAKIRGYALAH